MSRNSWRIMWVLAMFDLPTGEKEEIRAYTTFKNTLLLHGFIRIQFSVYTKHFPTLEKAMALVKELGKETPKNGKVSFFYLTDKQYGMTESFFGTCKDKNAIPKIQEQFILF